MISTGNNTIDGVTYKGGLAGQIDQNTLRLSIQRPSKRQQRRHRRQLSSRRQFDAIQRVTASQLADLGHSTHQRAWPWRSERRRPYQHHRRCQFFSTSRATARPSIPPPTCTATGSMMPMTGSVSTRSFSRTTAQPLKPLLTFRPARSRLLQQPFAQRFADRPRRHQLQPSGSRSPPRPLGAAHHRCRFNAVVTGNGPTNAPYAVTFGTTSISGTSPFNASNNGTAAGVLNLGAISDGGNASTIQFGGNGTINLNCLRQSVSPPPPSPSTPATPSGQRQRPPSGNNAITITNNGTLVVNANQTIGNTHRRRPLTVGNGTTASTLQLAANTGASESPP